MEYWKQYYQQNAKKINEQKKKWQQNNPEKTREYTKKYYYKDIELSRERSRKNFKKWASVPENRMHKKEYQKQWFKSNFQMQKKENEEMKQLLKRLEKGKANINGYEITLRQDKGGQYFYSMVKNNVMVYISDKFSTKEALVKDLQYAI